MNNRIRQQPVTNPRLLSILPGPLAGATFKNFPELEGQLTPLVGFGQKVDRLVLAFLSGKLLAIAGSEENRKVGI